MTSHLGLIAPRCREARQSISESHEPRQVFCLLLRCNQESYIDSGRIKVQFEGDVTRFIEYQGLAREMREHEVNVAR